jgi:hypothetical protein
MRGLGSEGVARFGVNEGLKRSVVDQGIKAVNQSKNL